MADPVIEQIKAEICEEFEVPLTFFNKFIELEDEKVHYTRRHGLIEDLRKLVAQTARVERQVEPE
jgi:hypothetical protein